VSGRVLIPEDKIADLKRTCTSFLISKRVSVKELRSFAGQCSSIGTLIPTWKPFTNELWGALNAIGTQRAGSPPAGCVWTRQIQGAVEWMLEFLDPGRLPDEDWQPGTGLIRTWLLSAYLRRGDPVSVTLDASPWGLGAVLEIGHVAITFISDQLTEDDELHPGAKIGDPDGQQAFESLIVLVALRAWKSYWRTTRITLRVSGDNYTVLTLLLSMKAKGLGVSLVGRELALDLGDGAFRPNLVEHLPGVSNVTADVISRQHAPRTRGGKWTLPPWLAGVERTAVPKRSSEFYRTLRSRRPERPPATHTAN